jgi:hypothetical protein
MLTASRTARTQTATDNLPRPVGGDVVMEASRQEIWMKAPMRGAGRHGRARLAVTRSVAAACIALLVLAGTVGSARAEYPTMGTQHEFVQTCKKLGGTPKREGTRIVSCTKGGTTETCNFNTNTCVTVLTQPTDSNDPSAPNGGGVLAQNDPAPSGTGGGGTWVAETGGTWIVFAEDDDEP